MKLQKVIDLRKDKFILLSILILVLSLVLRLYKFNTLWGIASDDSRDVMIAKIALERHEFPMIGSFSSAGPFVFGPLFYWFIMLCYTILPIPVNSPWLIMLILGMLSVFLMMKITLTVFDKKTALIAGLLAASSPQMITRSNALTQHSFIGISSIVLFLLFILFFKKRKLIYCFFMGISLGFALSMHYQAINLFIFAPLILLVEKVSIRKKILGILIFSAGFLIPSLPLLVWDVKQQFANTRNILDYLFIAQYRIYVPNSWKLFLFNYFPQFWSFVTGGYRQVALVIMFLTGIVAVISIVKRKVSYLFLLLASVFLILVIINRYYKGERFEGYLLYFQPFILFFTAWMLKKVTAFNKIIGFTLITIIVFTSIVSQRDRLKYNNHVSRIYESLNQVNNIYPGQKISVYDLRLNSSEISFPISMIAQSQKKISADGVKIGICRYCPETNNVIYKFDEIYAMSDLTKTDEINMKDWRRVNPDDIYDDLIGWSQNKKLTSNYHNPIIDFLIKLFP